MTHAWFIAIVGAVAFAATPAFSESPVTLKFGFPPPATSYVNTKGITPWIKAVEAASGGTLKIKLYAGPTLGTIRNIYERTLADVAQISFGPFGPLASQFPRTQVAGLPFVADDSGPSSVALWRLYAKGLFNPEYSKVKVLALFNFTNSDINTDKPIHTIANLKGMKLAVSSRGVADAIAALGAAPVSLTPPEIYRGMSQGLIDGSANSWTAVKVFRLAEVTHFHLELPLGQLPAFVFMNKAAYAGLPAKAKAAIEKYSGEAFSRTLGEASQAADSQESKKVAGEPGQTVAQLSPAQRKIWDARLDPLIAAWVKRTPQGATVLAAYRAEIAKASAAR